MASRAPSKVNVELEFEIRTTDKELKAIDAVRKLLKLSPDLKVAFEKKYPNSKAKIKIRRVEGLPIAALVHHLIVSIDWHVVKAGVETAVAQFATTQFLKLAKKKVRGAFAKATGTGFAPASSHSQSKEPNPSATTKSQSLKSSAKKVAAKKSVLRKKKATRG